MIPFVSYELCQARAWLLVCDVHFWKPLAMTATVLAATVQTYMACW